MSEETKTIPETQADNANPAATSPTRGTGEQDSQARTFTQEEVNKIVSDRLARERTKADPVPDEREKALAAREGALACREFIEANKDYPPELLSVLDTTDLKAFKAMADKLIQAFPHISPSTPRFVPNFSGTTHGTVISSDDKIAEAFKPRQ